MWRSSALFIVVLSASIVLSDAKLNSRLDQKPERIMKPPQLVPTYLDPPDAPKGNMPKDAIASQDESQYISIKEHEAEMTEAKHDAHRVFGCGVVTALVVTSVLIMMLGSSNKTVAAKTWHMIDHVVQHFLGIAWFIVVKEGLSYLNLEGWPKVIVHGVVALAFILAYIYVSFAVRNDKEALSIYTGIFLILTVWANIGFVSTLQSHGKSMTQVAVVTAGVACFYALVAAIMFPLISATCQKGWGDVGIDITVGKVLAAGFVLWTHMLISGSYQEVVGHSVDPPTWTHKVTMMSLSCVWLIIACIVKPKVDAANKRIAKEKYWNARFLNVVSKFLNFLPHFAFAASFGHLIIESGYFSPGDMEAMLALAVSNTFIACLCVLIAANIPDAGGAGKIFLGLGAFIMAVAWAKLLNNSADMMLAHEGYGHPFLMKICVTAILTAFVFPAYCLDLKPAIMAGGGD